MDLRIAKAIVKAGEASNFTFFLETDYSGRCMYGETTTGVSGSETEILQAVIENSHLFEGMIPSDGKGSRGRFSSDQMGHDIIIY
jgi:hypothetical protein